MQNFELLYLNQVCSILQAPRLFRLSHYYGNWLSDQNNLHFVINFLINLRGTSLSNYLEMLTHCFQVCRRTEILANFVLKEEKNVFTSRSLKESLFL